MKRFMFVAGLDVIISRIELASSNEGILCKSEREPALINCRVMTGDWKSQVNELFHIMPWTKVRFFSNPNS
jgi:hypothetical protein